MTPIPLVDLRAQYRAIKPEIDAAIQRVLDSGQFILGPEVEALERELAAYCGTTHAVGVASGTDALALALRACGIGPGDEVITTAFSFFATAEAIVLAGAAPVFADIELETYALDPDDVASRITPRTKAILPVHLYGHPCAMDRVTAIAKAHGLKVIEDCAQAIGAQFQGRRVGGFGDAGCLSFYPSKNLGAYGDGGMVVTNSATVARQVRLQRAHGSPRQYHHVMVGTNSRLDELQAAVLRVKLRHLTAWNAARRRNAHRYGAAFRRRQLHEVVVPQELPMCTHTYHLYSIRAPHRAAIQRTLHRQGIATQVAYPRPLPSQPALRRLHRRPPAFPMAQEAARTVLALPMYPELSRSSIERVVAGVARTLRQRR